MHNNLIKMYTNGYIKERLENSNAYKTFTHNTFICAALPVFLSHVCMSCLPIVFYANFAVKTHFFSTFLLVFQLRLCVTIWLSFFKFLPSSPSFLVCLRYNSSFGTFPKTCGGDGGSGNWSGESNAEKRKKIHPCRPFLDFFSHLKKKDGKSLYCEMF